MNELLIELPENADEEKIIASVVELLGESDPMELMGLLLSTCNLIHKLVNGSDEQVAYLLGEATFCMASGMSLVEYADECHSLEGLGMKGESVRMGYPEIVSQL